MDQLFGLQHRRKHPYLYNKIPPRKLMKQLRGG